MKAILFVDDNEVLARLSCDILETQGYRAVCAYNASDALEKFDQEKFDALFERLLGFLQGRDVFVQDVYVGADEQ